MEVQERIISGERHLRLELFKTVLIDLRVYDAPSNNQGVFMRCTRSLSWALVHIVCAGFLVVTLPRPAVAQSNPCAPKATKGSQDPCAAKNPYSVKNPCAANACAPGGKAGSAAAKAVTVKGEVVRIDPGTRKLVLKRESGLHGLAIVGRDEKIPYIEFGETQSLTINFDKPGEVIFYCPQPGHRNKGMEGEFSVGKAQ